MTDEKISALLSDDRYESKDWKQADLAGRIEWLIIMLRAKNEEVDKLASIINDNLVPRELEKAMSDDLDEHDTRDATPEEDTMLGTIMAQKSRIEELEKERDTYFAERNKFQLFLQRTHADWELEVAAVEGLNAKLAKAVEALEKLARLGNGDRYGNSDGNMIARATLAELKVDQP